MRAKYSFWIMIIGLTLLTSIGVSAQANTVTCPTLVQESFTATEFLCESVLDGQACIGNGVVSSIPLEGATVQFANPGEFANLADMQRLQVQTMSTATQAWTSVTGKLEASTLNGDPEIVDMLVFGDAVVTNALVQDTTTPSTGVLPATIEAGGGVIVRQDARADSNNIWQLLNGEKIQAIGRSNDNQWIRIILPSANGGAGWIFSQFVNVEGGRELLPFHTNASPIPAGSDTQTTATLKSMQAFRLESVLTDRSCAETPDSGVMLQSSSLDQRALVEVNGVELRFKGTVYITAQVADKMTIVNLEGETAVIIDDSRVDMTLATVTEIPLDANLAPIGVASAVIPYSQEVADLLQFLPIRLLSRNFAVSTVDASSITDINSPAEQQAPPPPVPTEVPVEQPPANVECPTLVQGAYTATEQMCNLGANTACIGNTGANMITATAREGVENFTFADVLDKVNTTDIDALTTRVFDDPDNIWVSIAMTLDTKTTTGAMAQATILVFGEVDIENQGEDPSPMVATADAPVTDTTTVAPPPVTNTDTTTDTTTIAEGTPATVEAPGPVVVRLEPRVDTETTGQVQDTDAVMALGRSVDQLWVQIQYADGLTGWVFGQFIVVEGGVESLPVIDPNATPAVNTSAPPPATNQQPAPPPAGITTGNEPEFTSMQAFDFASNKVSADCADTSNSGIMIQSPDDMDGNMRLLINGVEFEINGTLYLRASRNQNMTIVSLEGESIITSQGTSQTVVAGQQASVEMANGLEPAGVPSIPGDYSFKKGQRFLSLPIRLLPRSPDVIVPPAPPEENTVNRGTTPSTTTTVSSDVVNIGGTTVNFKAACEISAGDTVRNIRADAGSEFDVTSVLQVGQTITGITQKRGTDKIYYWYETAKGWIRSDAGITTPDCENLPLYGVIYDTSPSGGAVAAVAPVAPLPPPQPTAPPPPPITSDAFGNVCESGSFATSAEVEESGRTYIEFGGVWTGQAGQSVTFSAEIPYFRPELLNVLTFVNEDGSPWLGSISNTAFTISFESNRRFRVRVAALLGDFVTLRVSC